MLLLIMFFGKEKMFPHVFSNIIEDITRLFLLLIGNPYFFIKDFLISFTIHSSLFPSIRSVLRQLILLSHSTLRSTMDPLNHPCHFLISILVYFSFLKMLLLDSTSDPPLNTYFNSSTASDVGKIVPFV